MLKIVSVLIMCACLSLLTGVNFFLYGQAATQHQMAGHHNQDDRSAEKPVEQKSSNTNTSIQEEYVHEQHTFHGIAANYNLSNYCLLDAAKLAVVHFELISPPPDYRVALHSFLK